jgi:hypothetical protein
MDHIDEFCDEFYAEKLAIARRRDRRIRKYTRQRRFPEPQTDRMEAPGPVDPNGLIKIELIGRYGRLAAEKIIDDVERFGITVRDSEHYYMEMTEMAEVWETGRIKALEADQQNDIARLLGACTTCGVPCIACMCDESDPESEAGKELLAWADSKYEEIVDRIREDV